MTPIDPPPGQLDKVAEAIRDCGHASPRHACMTCAWAETAARAVWDAVAEGLGLGEETRMHFDCPQWRADRPERRLVSKWEPQP